MTATDPDKAYQFWEQYPLGGEYAGVQKQQGLTIEQLDRVFSGRPLIEPPRQVRIMQLTEGVIPDVMGTAWGGLVVTERVKTILENIDTDKTAIQFIPAGTEEQPKLLDTSWWLLHVSRALDCVDFEQSRYDTFPEGTIKKIKRLRLRPLPDDVPLIFRLKEVLPHILVHDELRLKLLENISTPGRFIPVGKFKW